MVGRPHCRRRLLAASEMGWEGGRERIERTEDGLGQLSSATVQTFAAHVRTAAYDTQSVGSEKDGREGKRVGEGMK